MLRSEAGISIVELLIAALVSSLIALIAFAALDTVGRTDTHTSDDSRALAAMRAATQRFTRELRQSGKIYFGSTGKRITFWVDYNRNTSQEDAEHVIWELANVGSEVQLRRTTRADELAGLPPEPWVIDDLLLEDAFTYAPAPPTTSLVTIKLAADVDADRAGPPRRVQTRIRLRNVPS